MCGFPPISSERKWMGHGAIRLWIPRFQERDHHPSDEPVRDPDLGHPVCGLDGTVRVNRFTLDCAAFCQRLQQLTESSMQRFPAASRCSLPESFSPAPVVLAQSPSQRLELDRKGETIVLEPYAPNILRVTLSLKREPALAAPGYGFVAAPAADGWSASQTEQADVYQSARIVATVDRDHAQHQASGSDAGGHRKVSSTAPLPARTSRCARPRARRCWS